MTSFNSIGDLSRSFQLRLGQSSLKSKLDRLTQEMMTGVKSDVPKALGGDLTKISHIEARLTMLSTFQLNISEAQAQFQGMQTALDSMRKTVDDLGPSLLTQAGSAGEDGLRAQLDGISQSFRSMFDTLNSGVAGRYVFAGSRSDTAPLGSFDDMVTALGVAVAGAGTATDIATRIDAWFDAPAGGGGFADTTFQGDDTGSTQLSVAPDRQVSLSLTANSPAMRDTLKGMAIMAYAADAGTGLDGTTLRNLFTEAGARLIKGSTGLIRAQTDLGQRQAVVAQAQSRNAAEVTALSVARSNLINADPYETATALEETEANIKSLYALTSRLSRLNLTDYL
ncbi:flagellar hook protein [Paracoccus aminovorans]|uniref:flagellar hook protein n=1 Tax=Paracoccus aminovorans TaxID=34004 RepID=UPI002B2600F5|nr:flagellar hook protein [Paracoccus aminovorans]